MSYDNDIIRILTEAGTSGLSVMKLSRHVYNSKNTFFNTISFDEVYRSVTAWLHKNSKTEDALVEKTRRGIYRLNLNSGKTHQMMLQFREEEQQQEEKPQQDLSLSLFDSLF